MIKLSDIELSDNDIIYESDDDSFYRLLTIMTTPVPMPSIPASAAAALLKAGIQFLLSEEVLSNTKVFFHNENTPVTITYAFNSLKSKELAGEFSKSKQPCVILNQIKFWWSEEYFSIVCFLTDNPINDTFIIHPNDLGKIK